MSWWDRIRGKQREPAAPPPGIEPQDSSGSDLEQLCQLSAEKRAAFWASVGKVDDDVLGQIIASRFLNDIPVWPSGRERFLVVRKERTTILATDGLSDPDEAAFQTRNGHGIELYIEAPSAQLTHPIGSPYLEILTQMSRNVAHHGDWFGSWQKWQLLSLQLPGQDERMADANGNHLLLLGYPGFDRVPAMPGMPLSPVKPMAVTVVHPADFAVVAEEVTSRDRNTVMAGRRRLADALESFGAGLVSDLDRAPVLCGRSKG